MIGCTLINSHHEGAESVNRSIPLLTSFVIAVVVIAVRADDSRQLSIVSRQTILEKDDVQLHFPFLHEAQDET